VPSETPEHADVVSPRLAGRGWGWMIGSAGCVPRRNPIRVPIHTDATAEGGHGITGRDGRRLTGNGSGEVGAMITALVGDKLTCDPLARLLGFSWPNALPTARSIPRTG
jgi:hypothetical protein